jgi:hypothetical protein
MFLLSLFSSVAKALEAAFQANVRTFGGTLDFQFLTSKDHHHAGGHLIQ